MTAAAVDIDAILETLDQMAAQRPVAARIVATSNNEQSSAADLAAVLGADVALAAKVMKLANSAYFGLSGNVTSLQLAVTVVGFNTVRSIATVALSGIDTAKVPPDGFWTTSIHLAAASGNIGPPFQERTADAMCLGLLAQLGAALLHQHDSDGYDELLAKTHLGPQRFTAEAFRYGFCAPRLTAEALEQWRFPVDMVEALRAVASSDPEGALLRTAYELTARLLQPGHRKLALERLSDGRITELQSRARLVAIRTDVEELRTALSL